MSHKHIQLEAKTKFEFHVIYSYERQTFEITYQLPYYSIYSVRFELERQIIKEESMFGNVHFLR